MEHVHTHATTGSFDGIAEGYDFIGSLVLDRNEFFLSNLTDARDSVLDVGCGSGILAAELAEHYARVVGIDLSDGMLAIARAKRARANVEYRNADANDLKLDEKFDLIVSSTTFHHLDDVPRTLEGLKGLLRPGGRILIVDCVLWRLAWLNRFASRHPWVHAVSALEEFPRFVRRSGLRNAVRALRFKMSKPWCAHLASDPFLEPAEFRVLYGAALPGCEFSLANGLMAVRWDAPTVLTPSS
jgi:ubiquinone/menaquinone biosynthesis C-methylase UbiE